MPRRRTTVAVMGGDKQRWGEVGTSGVQQAGTRSNGRRRQCDVAPATGNGKSQFGSQTEREPGAPGEGRDALGTERQHTTRSLPIDNGNWQIVWRKLTEVPIFALVSRQPTNTSLFNGCRRFDSRGPMDHLKREKPEVAALWPIKRDEYALSGTPRKECVWRVSGPR